MAQQGPPYGYLPPPQRQADPNMGGYAVAIVLAGIFLFFMLVCCVGFFLVSQSVKDTQQKRQQQITIEYNR